MSDTPELTVYIIGSVKYLLVGKNRDNRDVVLRMFKKMRVDETAEEVTSQWQPVFYTWGTDRNDRELGDTDLEAVTVWDAAFQPVAATQESQMKKVKDIWLAEIGEPIESDGASGGVKIKDASSAPSRGSPSNAPATSSSPAVSADTPIRKRPKLAPSSDLIWKPDGTPLNKTQTRYLGQKMKQAMGLSVEPPHHVVQGMARYKYLMGDVTTPFKAPVWFRWLRETDNILPPREMDTSIEALFDVGPEVRESWKPRTREEKVALFGEGSVSRMEALIKELEDWTADLEAVGK
ncbi:hypothetical protein N0V83_006337 [Neocucurbitaria cava]|uniref:Uncharacterized protein n=1 Tax=Neocucurbitaria cava TaxID=798079 RepID=A0A9W8Y745_9PLEO|nr:hypothetical protein N0V83_006337 [Neocucurbitaria cava]